MSAAVAVTSAVMSAMGRLWWPFLSFRSVRQIDKLRKLSPLESVEFNPRIQNMKQNKRMTQIEFVTVVSKIQGSLNFRNLIEKFDVLRPEVGTRVRTLLRVPAAHPKGQGLHPVFAPEVSSPASS